ncbi:MAG: transcription initiation factor IIB family protein [Candidatus Hodarchaeota archaeon]
MSDEVCTSCGSTSLVLDSTHGILVCSECGVISDTLVIDPGPEWRAYTTEEESSRARSGNPVTLLNPNMGLTSQFEKANKDAQGRFISKEKRVEFSRLASLVSRSDDAEERNLKAALRELKRLKSQLQLPDDVAEEASRLYRKTLKSNLIRGRSIDGMVTAALYLACRSSNFPLTLKDIAEMTHLQQKELGRYVRIIVKALEIKRKPADLKTLVYRLGEDLDMTIYTRRLACKILEDAVSAGITIGKNPMNVAAAAIYISGIRTGERRTQQQIAQVAKTTPVTIRNRFKELVKVLQIEKIVIKRGAAATAVYASDPRQFELQSEEF